MPFWSRHKEKYSDLELSRVPVKDTPTNKDVSISHSKETLIDCTFLGNTSNEYYSKTGLLGDRPAALVFLDLHFPQYQDAEVKFADITLSFRASETGEPTEVTGHFGPVQLCGQEVRREGKIGWRVMPEVGAMGVTVRGVDIEGSRDATIRAAWTFKSQRLPDDDGTYNKLKWEWKANELQKDKSKIIHVGFIVLHGSSVLATETVIQGKFARGWLRRSFEAEPMPTLMKLQLNSSTTKFEKRSLKLRKEMENKNVIEGTVEIDDVRRPQEEAVPVLAN